MKKQILCAAVLATLGVAASTGAQAAVVNSGDILTINTGTTGGAYGFVTGGSYFAMNLNNNGGNNPGERTALSQGIYGLVIGTTTAAGAHHVGAPAPGDTGPIDKSWGFGGNTGTDYLTVAVTGSTTAGLNMSGWTVAWSTINAIPMGTGAWTPTNCAATPGCTSPLQNGIGDFDWDGVYGHAYTLNYSATVPNGDPSGFGNVRYFLHLEGIVTAVPVPAAVWLLGSGLLGLVGVARRKKKA